MQKRFCNLRKAVFTLSTNLLAVDPCTTWSEEIIKYDGCQPEEPHYDYTINKCISHITAPTTAAPTADRSIAPTLVPILSLIISVAHLVAP